MEYISTLIEVNVSDLQAAITAIRDGNSEVALVIMQEYLDTYNEEEE